MPTPTKTGKYKMNWLTRGVYDALKEGGLLNPYGLYWIKDQNIIFRGAEPLMDVYAFVNDFSTPYTGDIKPKTLCIKTSDVEGEAFLEARVLKEDYTWETVVPPVYGAITELTEDDKSLPTRYAVKTFVDDRLDALREYFDALENSMREMLQTAQQASEAAYDASVEAVTAANNAENSAVQAESYTVGGTDTRPGENTDNAKYYKEKAQEAAASASGDEETIARMKESIEQTAEEVERDRQDVSTMKDSVERSEQSASTSAANALTSEQHALASEQAAHTSEVNAKAYEDAAKLSEQHAYTSEVNAKASENAAASSESKAAISESNALASEQAAKRSEQAAASSESNAHNSEVAAAGSQGAAANSATAAANSATKSESYAVGGTDSRTGENTDNAKYYSQQADAQAQAASNSATASSTSATKSESYAVGGTNSRTGEDTDNAKYYSQQADNSASAAADSAASAEDDATLSKSYAVGGTNSRTGEDTDNSEYYKTQAENSATSAAASATLSESWAVGGTDTREGEDENNAKYYAELAEHFSPAGKADKPNPLPEENGNVAALTTEGNLLDTGIPSDNVAKKDGNYQEEGFHSATAGNLIDQNATPVEASFGFRTAAGEVSITDDSNGVIDKFKGTTQVQNQLVHDTNQNEKSSVDGKLSVSDAVGDNVSKMLVKGGCVVHNQLVKESISKTTSGTGRLGCSDGVAGNAESFVMTAPISVVMNQWIDTGDTEVILANGRTWLTYIGGVSSKVSGAGQSVSCTGGTDMAVDLTQYFNGNTTLINSITSWDDLVAYDPSFASYVVYNTGTVKGVTPTVKVNYTTDVICPVELFGVNDTIGDSFDGVSGVFTRYIKQYTITGTEYVIAYSNYLHDDACGLRLTMPTSIGTIASGIAYSNLFTYSSGSVLFDNNVVNRCNIEKSTRVLNLRIANTLLGITDISQETPETVIAKGKAFLKSRYDNGDPVYIYFASENPVTEQYTPTTIPTLNIYNNAVQTSNERPASLAMTYQGREQTIAIDPTHTYVFNDNQVGDSLVTNESSINVVGGEDMLVDLTRFYNGDTTKISQIQRWKSFSTRYHRYRDLLPYNAGTVEPETPVIHVYPDEYAYGVVYNPNQTSPACQKVVLRNGVITEVEDFDSMPCHQLYRCVMDNLGTRHIAYYLDDTDSTKKYNGTRNGVTSDGSASVLTGADGDVMVEMPISYWYLDEDYNGEGKYLWLISDRPFMGTHGSAEIHDYFYVSPDGATCRTQYVGAYRASVCNEDGTPINTTEGAYSQATGTSSTNKARSIAGALPYVNINQNDLRTRAIRNNSGSTVNSKFHQWLFILMMIEKGSLNTQSISAGYSNGISNANYCFWRKSGRVNAGNGTNKLYAVEGTQDMDNFQSFKIGSTTVQRDTLKDADGRYAWSVNSRGSTTTRYFTDSPTPTNGDTVYSASTGDTSAGTVSSYTLKTGRVIQFQYRGIENPFGEVWEFEHGIQKYCHAFTSSIKVNNVVYNRDPVNNGSNSLAWTKADGTVTVWTPRSLTNAHTYTDPDLTQDTGYAVTVNGYYYDLRGYYETLSTSDYTGTEQATANNPTYTWKRHRWPIGSNYIKTFDPLTFFVLTTPGSATTYLPDYYYDNVGTGARVVYRGGTASSGASVGLGYVHVYYGLATSNVTISGRLSA